MEFYTAVLYPPPRSLYLTVMYVITFAGMANGGLNEARGAAHVQYSKFFGSNNNNKKKGKIVPSKIGMIIAYLPAFIVAFSSLWIFPHKDLRFYLVSFALSTHFFKRLFEVLFVHMYSGSMDLEATITISLSYLTHISNMIYAQNLTSGLNEPKFDLKIAGVVIFFIGIIGNFYHHYLLSSLRTKGERQYKIPQGGLFNVVVCPHYLFGVLGFFGASCVSQTLYVLTFTLGSTFYLMGRSVATKRWYLSKFENFPKDRRAMIPYLF